MRGRKVGVGAVATAVALSVLTGPVGAKGPTIEDATIDGPGLEGPIDYPRDAAYFAAYFSRLPSLTGLWTVLSVDVAAEPAELRTYKPRGHLGPGLVITWELNMLEIAPPTAGDATPEIRQDVYPYATGGPLVHTRAGQPLGGSHRTIGGWYRAHPALVDMLHGLGVPPYLGAPGDVTRARAGDSTERPEREATASLGGGARLPTWWLVVPAGALFAAGAGVGRQCRRREPRKRIRSAGGANVGGRAGGRRGTASWRRVRPGEAVWAGGTNGAGHDRRSSDGVRVTPA